MLKFEDIFKRDDEEGKVLQADEFTRLEKKGKTLISTSLYFSILLASPYVIS